MTRTETCKCDILAHQVRGGPVFCIADGVILGRLFVCRWLTDIFIATLYYWITLVKFSMSLSPATYACLAPKETNLLTFLSFIIRTHPGRNSPLGPKEIKLYTFSTAIIIRAFAVVIEHT